MRSTFAAGRAPRCKAEAAPRLARPGLSPSKIVPISNCVWLQKGARPIPIMAPKTVPTIEEDVLEHAEPADHVVVLMDGCNAPPGLPETRPPQVRRVPVHDPVDSRVREEREVQHAEERGLSGTARPDQRDSLPRAHVQADHRAASIHAAGRTALRGRRGPGVAEAMSFLPFSIVFGSSPASETLRRGGRKRVVLPPDPTGRQRPPRPRRSRQDRSGMRGRRTERRIEVIHR